MRNDERCLLREMVVMVVMVIMVIMVIMVMVDNEGAGLFFKIMRDGWEGKGGWQKSWL